MDNKGKKLTSIEITDTEFTANGKLYFIEPELSAERFRKMQELEIELGYGASYQQLFKGLQKSYDLLNEMKNADAE